MLDLNIPVPAMIRVVQLTGKRRSRRKDARERGKFMSEREKRIHTQPHDNQSD
jgi:hypothetical protein